MWAYLQYLCESGGQNKRSWCVYTERSYINSEIGRLQRSWGNLIKYTHANFGVSDRGGRVCDLRLGRRHPETYIIRLRSRSRSRRLYICERNVLTKTYLKGTIVNLTKEHHKSRFKRRRRRRRLLSPVRGWAALCAGCILYNNYVARDSFADRMADGSLFSRHLNTALLLLLL